MNGDETLLLTTAVVAGLSVMLMIADVDGQTIVLKVAGGASLCKADRVDIAGGLRPRLRTSGVMHFTWSPDP
jgi:hypothetical protein